jgi:hypothetical protein
VADLSLSASAFTRWDGEAQGWVPQRGDAELLVGWSAGDVVHRVAVAGG